MIGTPELFLRGVLLGLAVAAPVGPIGVLCIQRSLSSGFWAGFSGGIGTAAADAVYAGLAAAGFAAFGSALESADGWLRWGGAAVVAWLGLRTILRPHAKRAAAIAPAKHSLRLLIGTFALTISNPTTILSFAALFATMGLAEVVSPTARIAAVAGVFIGSLLWWAFLSGFLSIVRHSINDAGIVWINRIAGGVLIVFAGLLAL
ncbi:MAG TPA: LysE family transporter [Ferrovibrio sp.]|uniref:LysE family translocator n=1 Tax=Ferrovibrio sp. TaxID=1917215 RepID=UPI002ED1CAF8